MDEKVLKDRTKQFSLRVIKLSSSLPNTLAAQVIGRQLVKSGTSVGANYRAAYRARSKAEFSAKLGIVEEEADESAFWMEIIILTRQLNIRNPVVPLSFPRKRESSLFSILLDSGSQLRYGRNDILNCRVNRKRHAKRAISASTAQ